MTAPLWTSEALAAATGGVAAPGLAVTGISIDSRTVEPGDLFVALVGDRDGHAFAPDALRAGAAMVMASHAVDGPSLLVRDTQKALDLLAGHARDRAGGCRRAAVTGSVGKTSTTQALAAALRLAGTTHAPVKSYNNHIGVPLTLAALPPETRFAVFEAGMSAPGELRRLTAMIRPHVAIVTTVGGAHARNFADGEAGVARAKAEIFEGVEPDGAAVINADIACFDLLREAAERNGARILTFGTREGADARLLAFDRVDAGARATVSVQGRRHRLHLAQPGLHWAMNSLAVLLAVEALGAPVEAALNSLAAFAPLRGRGAECRLQVAGGHATLIDDSYNANPLSMAAALDSLQSRPAGGRRLAALTDMLELGDGEAELHRRLAPAIEAAGVDLLFAAGPMMRHLYDALPPSARGIWAPSAAELVPAILEALRPDDVLIVKGSNGSRAWQIVQALQADSMRGHA